MNEKSKNSTSYNSLKKSSISRRKFLKNSLVLTAGITFVGCSDVLVSPTEKNPLDSKIIIIGAGLSGLVAAYELSKTGYDVVILEASSRVGGRVHTIREPFWDEQFAEAGAARIPPNHNHTLRYINEFGLHLDHFYPRTGNFVKYYNGNRNIISNANYLAERPWPGSVAHSEYSKITGGTDQLPNAFANYLSNKIILNSPVKTVEQDSGKVRVIIENGIEFTSERVIVTVPLTLLNSIEFNPQLSSEKLEAAKGDYNYASSTRGYLQTSNRFWEKENLNGWGRTDWPEEMWQPTFDQNGDGGILMNYTSYSRADELDRLSNNERIISLLSRWNAIFPKLTANFERGTSFSWVNNKWAQGAYAAPTESQANKYDKHLSMPEGRIHFAGEHISNYHGWMQGALASGLRVVNEVVEREIFT